MNTQQHWLIAQFREGFGASNRARALQDMWDGFTEVELWGVLGLHDIRQRYRRSKIGPFWITLSMGILIGALGLVYGKLFGRALDSYLTYLAAGFLVWSFIATTILDGARVFLRSGGMIKQLTAPLSVYVLRMVWENLIIFLHNIWIFVGLAVWFGIGFSWVTLLAVPGLLLLLINGLWVGLLFGLLSARFRDIPLMLQSSMQLIFFLTPVIWEPGMMPGRPLLISGNPFYHFLELVRAPLLGQMPTLDNLLVVLAVTVVGWAVALAFFVVYRWRIPYWV